MMLFMTARDTTTRVVQVTVSVTHCKVRMHFERWQHKGTALRQKHETTIVVGTTGVEPSDDDLARYAYAIAYWVIDPRKRHIRPLPFNTWQQLGAGDDVTHPHGADVDGRQMAMEPLPLIGGWTQPPQPSTIKTRPAGVGAARAKRARPTARAPIVRDLRTGEHGDPDGA